MKTDPRKIALHNTKIGSISVMVLQFNYGILRR